MCWTRRELILVQRPFCAARGRRKGKLAVGQFAWVATKGSAPCECGTPAASANAMSPLPPAKAVAAPKVGLASFLRGQQTVPETQPGLGSFPSAPNSSSLSGLHQLLRALQRRPKLNPRTAAPTSTSPAALTRA